MSNKNRTHRRATSCLSAVICLWLAGCATPSASLQLLDGLEEALENVSTGQQAVRQAVTDQLTGQQQALDAAFEADLRNLADPGEQAALGEPTVKLSDVLSAKRLYDRHRTELEAGRANATEAFDRLQDNLAASRQIAGMLRRLTLQQHALAGQAELAVEALIRHRSAGRP